MGDYYEFKCNECGHEISYYIGGGFSSYSYYDKMKKAEEKLKKDIMKGKYGEHLKRVIESDEKEFVFSCQEKLYQCNKCKRIFVLTCRRIIHSKIHSYKAEIEFDEYCPKCKNEFSISKISEWKAINCPKCKKGIAVVAAIGNWD